MSTSVRLNLQSAPRGARVSSKTLDEISAELIEARCERAREAGRREAGAEVAGGAGRALDEAARLLDEAREKAEAELGTFAVELAIEIASLLLRMEVDAGRYDLERIVRDTLAASGVGRAPCVVHLNPADIEKLEGVPFRKGTELEADASLAQGDVHVTTPQGLLVRELDSLLDSIRTGLFGELR